MKIHSLLIVACVATQLLTGSAAAQDYPNRPVRIVVPFTPGGFNDIVARILGAQLSQRLGQQFIIDNKAGAGGTIAGEIVANAPKDGHTLMIVSVAVTINPWLRKFPYDAVKSFTPVAVLATAPNVTVVNAALPAKTVKEFIALAKSKPGELKYASSGVGTFLHLAGELFKLETGTDLLHVPFRGAGPALINVMGGDSQASFASVPSVLTHVRSGKLRALQVGGDKRSAALPDVPTAAEAGLPNYRAANWIGIVAPAGTPSEVVAKLHKEISIAQDSAELRKAFTQEGADVLRMSPAEFGALIVSETDRWGKVIKQANIKPE